MIREEESRNPKRYRRTSWLRRNWRGTMKMSRRKSLRRNRKIARSASLIGMA